MKHYLRLIRKAFSGKLSATSILLLFYSVLFLFFLRNIICGFVAMKFFSMGKLTVIQELMVNRRKENKKNK